MNGVLLLNLGSPSAPTSQAVKPYLAEFLMDPYVIDIPWIARWLLVHGIILRTRPKKTAALYKKVWTEKGSPLIAFSLAQQSELQKKLGSEFCVELGMRYGSPSIRNALLSLKNQNITSLTIIPLYPQYSLAATESLIQKVYLEIHELGLQGLSPHFVQDFYNHPLWIKNYAKFLENHLIKINYDHLLFSYHGLPERQVKKTDPTKAHCLQSADCCLKATKANRKCYRFQCIQTTVALAQLLKLKQGQYSDAFQSRLGSTPWIKPYTDLEYDRLAKQGVKTLVVVSPSFVADCLETLEEIAIRGSEQFKEAGGKELIYIPALNSDPSFVEFLADLARNPLQNIQG
jgi:ferrochelatase